MDEVIAGMIDSKPHLIKKYANRRLYDTDKSVYITLDDLKQYVLEYTTFTVIDAKTSSDVTKACLLQIILELESTHHPLFTQSTLEHMVRFYGSPIQTMLKEYLEKSLELFIQQQSFTK